MFGHGCCAADWFDIKHLNIFNSNTIICNVRPHLQEGLLIQHLPFGPWLSEAWHGQIKEALGVFIRDHGSEHPLFLLFYPFICSDKGLKGDEHYGTPEHRHMVLNLVVADQCMAKKGSKIALRSFFGWVEAIAEELLPSWHSIGFVCSFIGLMLGHYCRHGKFPYPGRTGGKAMHEIEQAIDGEAQDVDRTVSELRKLCRNNIHVVAELLSDANRHFKFKIIASFSGPFKSAHRIEESDMLGVDATMQIHINNALGAWQSTLNNAVALLFTPLVLHKLGIKFQEAMVVSKYPLCVLCFVACMCPDMCCFFVALVSG